MILTDWSPHHKVVMAPCAQIISESEVSIMVLNCLLCSPYYTAAWINNCLKVIKVDTVKNMMVPHSPVSSEIKVSIALLSQLCSTRYAAVQIKKRFKGTSVIKAATMKNMDSFRYTKEAIMCSHQINAFHRQQRWMEHKGGHW